MYLICDKHFLRFRRGSPALLPLTSWSSSSYCPQTPGRRLPGGYRAVEVDVAIAEAEASTENALASLAACVEHALRADSPDAPATHAEAMRLGEIWVQSEAKELANHTRNQSWVTISRDELPQGRRVHKLICGSTKSSAMAQPNLGCACRAPRSRPTSTTSKSSPRL